jgi:hypothetical protein
MATIKKTLASSHAETLIVSVLLCAWTTENIVQVTLPSSSVETLNIRKSFNFRAPEMSKLTLNLLGQ